MKYLPVGTSEGGEHFVVCRHLVPWCFQTQTSIIKPLLILPSDFCVGHLALLNTELRGKPNKPTTNLWTWHIILHLLFPNMFFLVLPPHWEKPWSAGRGNCGQQRQAVHSSEPVPTLAPGTWWPWPSGCSFQTSCCGRYFGTWKWASQKRQPVVRDCYQATLRLCDLWKIRQKIKYIYIYFKQQHLHSTWSMQLKHILEAAESLSVFSFLSKVGKGGMQC